MIITTPRSCITTARGLLLLAFPAGLIAQTRGQPVPTVGAPQAFTAPWSTVFFDSAFRIGLDTSRVERVADDVYLIWLQTRWSAPRRGSTKTTATPFNRELIRTFLRCNPTQYKVVQTVVSLNDGPPIDSVGVGLAATKAGKWTSPSHGSADIGAGDRACAILRHRVASAPGTRVRGDVEGTRVVGGRRVAPSSRPIRRTLHPLCQNAYVGC